jgi:16S rRNA processing protein RimM
VRGALLVDPYSEVFASLQAGAEVLMGKRHASAVIQDCHAHGRHFLLYLEGCPDRDAAERWREGEVFVRIEQAAPLPEGTYYRWQILDLSVQTEDGEPLGKVAEILETGANDVYVVRNTKGSELLLPAIVDVVRRIDLAAGVMVVRLMAGLVPTAAREGGTSPEEGRPVGEISAAGSRGRRRAGRARRGQPRG